MLAEKTCMWLLDCRVTVILSQSVEGAILKANDRNTKGFSPSSFPCTGNIPNLCSAFTLRATASWLGRGWCVSVVGNTDECREVCFVVHRQF